eukprot:6682564-Pyramimonas_sp.AAC.1
MDMLEQGLQRQRELDLARHLGFSEGSRATLDLIRGTVAPKARRSTRYQKHVIQTCGCGGLWTNDRAMRAGCVCDGLCERGQPDTVHHSSLV